MDELKRKYVGKHLLVGITYLEPDDSVREQIQLHGSIVAISESTIVFKRNDKGEEFSIPYDEDNLVPSEQESVYELKSTGEVVKQVDFTSSWVIHPSTENENL